MDLLLHGDGIPHARLRTRNSALVDLRSLLEWPDWAIGSRIAKTLESAIARCQISKTPQSGDAQLGVMYGAIASDLRSVWKR